MSKVRVENLTKIFGNNINQALELVQSGKSKADILDETGSTVGVYDASFSVNEGEIFVIMGLSGSGKSTLVRMLNRLIEPTDGNIYIDGENVSTMNKSQLRQTRRNKISMVFQNFGLFPHRTILENTEYGLEVQGMSKNERQKKAEVALENAGLLPYANQYPDQLSGGMQQRVGLARALANDPEIILMDEAFSALDPLIRRDMQDELIEMQKTMNKTIIFITHDLNESLRLGDRIAIMKDGEVVQIGTGQEILTNPANDYVRRFVEDIDRSKVYTADHIMVDPTATVLEHDAPHQALSKMIEHNLSNILVINEKRHLIGYVTRQDVESINNIGQDDISDIILADVPEVDSDVHIGTLLDTVNSSVTPVAVTDDENVLEGIIVRKDVIDALTSSNEELTEEELTNE